MVARTSENFSFSTGNSFFLTNLVKKNQNCQFKLNFSTYTNSNMQNSMVVFILFVSDWKYPFWTHLFQKIKTVSLRWNLEPLLIRILRIQWRCSLFLFWTGNKLLGNLIQKIKIVSLSWNLVPRLIRICKTQWWCSLFLF